MPSDKHNSQMAKAKGLIFTLFKVPSGIPQCYNVFFMNLPEPSLELHLSLLTAKSIYLMVACDGFLCVTEFVLISIVATLCFLSTLCTGVYSNRLSKAGNWGMVAPLLILICKKCSKTTKLIINLEFSTIE